MSVVETPCTQPGYAVWQSSSPLAMHLYMYCVVHVLYDVTMWLAWEFVSKSFPRIRIDEIVFASWNIVLFLTNVGCAVFSWYLWYADFPEDFVGLHTWTTTFLAMFVVDAMFLYKYRMHFKAKIIRFLGLHHALTFGVCALYIASFTTPQLATPVKQLSMMPFLWNGSSVITNVSFLFRMSRGVGKIDKTLLDVTTICFVLQRTWRITSYCFFLYTVQGQWVAKVIIMTPGFIMDLFDSMSQVSAIYLLRKKLAEQAEHRSTAAALLRTAYTQDHPEDRSE